MNLSKGWDGDALKLMELIYRIGLLQGNLLYYWGHSISPHY